jgi:hypothetical protein
MNIILDVSPKNYNEYYKQYCFPKSTFMIIFYIILLLSSIFCYYIISTNGIMNFDVIYFYIVLPLIIVLHECIHYLGSKFVGAPEVRIGIYKFNAYAGPHNFMASFNQQLLISGLPMLIISIILIILFLSLPQKKSLISVLFCVQWLMALSDASWINAMYFHRGNFDYTICDLNNFSFKLIKS